MKNRFSFLIRIALCLFLLPGLCCMGCAKKPYVPGPTLELDNGVVCVRADLDYGGMITYLSLSGKNRNLINNFDRGRQVQASYYAGQPLDRRAEGQSPNWSPWPWNPIGAGDAYGNQPEIIDYSHDGSTLYIKTTPLLWDMNHEIAECIFESWISLEQNRVWVTNRLSVQRTDERWKVQPCHQEIPALYAIADLHHLYTYEGPEPFTHAPLKEIINRGPPWTYWGAPGLHEKWAALVDDEGWGLGLYSPDAESFVGGLHGEKKGDTQSQSTGYIAPLRTESLDKNSVFEYHFVLVVGPLEEIRSFVYEVEGYV